ncbi:hypothetical protein [Kordiimonas sp. SCSIO 12610]|uniref:hypothetical protein n=1 Tax=Kordiimonas sp. SCSIO 12610 TaxID=2829597 RepID=UPI00210EE986|nr:hypothetical protein [Kordiimonas sp. SCSIO 12610]UTW56152.1 hypothetical protein KFF44_04450 [Kordiimonas sp. SCSIO 12610]
MTKRANEHALAKTCKDLAAEAQNPTCYGASNSCHGANNTCAQNTVDHNHADSHDSLVETLKDRVEARLINATWTLRRMPDREAGFLYARQSIWPETVMSKYTDMPAKLSSLQTRKKIRPNAREIDDMQPALDLLLLLPDVADRKLLFWAAWHQAGEKQTRIPWAKVRASLQTNASRWTMKRKYDDGLKWLASIIALQA